MKKKNVLMMALSLCLVAVIAVGGTLAYLTDSDGKLTNTFQFAAGIQVELWEDQPIAVKDESITGNSDSGFNYTNVVPGQNLNKAPEFAVTTSVDTYVFARVTESSNVSVVAYDVYDETENADGWKKLEGNSDGKVVYYKEVTGAAGEKQELGALFTQVKVDDVDISGSSVSQTLNPITIEVAAIQMSGLDSPLAAYGEAEFQS